MLFFSSSPTVLLLCLSSPAGREWTEGLSGERGVTLYPVHHAWPTCHEQGSAVARNCVVDFLQLCVIIFCW